MNELTGKGIELLSRIQERMLEGKIESFALVAIDHEGDPLTGIICPNADAVKLIGGITILKEMMTFSFLQDTGGASVDLGDELEEEETLQ